MTQNEVLLSQEDSIQGTALSKGFCQDSVEALLGQEWSSRSLDPAASTSTTAMMNSAESVGQSLPASVGGGPSYDKRVR